ncbi:heme ABC transporter ATP-binding protein [Agromyces archimandritae]|uniref:Heme ABC transporter ATP-binding protein n=1 Tax=Agromyces archimandritae TaxID=2781962 RepID=A0A975FQE6_9MICO|nr:heme ABC transporter ATP-binding protein [Agromyces archimandritae]QTX05803.1 heme ABC transporter ATP-binding protein [Agromyces archimandritae]
MSDSRVDAVSAPAPAVPPAASGAAAGPVLAAASGAAAPAGAGPVLAARGLTVRIDGATLLDGVDFTASTGRVHALIGPNGAGKSTLLGVLAGDTGAVAAGTVAMLGRPVGAWSLKELARQRAVLTQEHQVSFPFPVREVVAMGRHPWARTPAADDDDAEVERAMADADVAHLGERTVPSLSGGERARVALARVVAQQAEVLLLDEPTAALDLKHQEDVMRLARAHAAAGRTVVVVLHELNVAAAYADDITLLRRGRVVATGSPAEVLTAERIEEVYGQAVDVTPHPRTGAPLVLPVR